MLTDDGLRFAYNVVKGRHTLGQVSNTVKYFLSHKREVLTYDPIYITIHTVFKCNLDCDMCMTHSTKHDNIYGQKTRTDMDYETLRLVVDKFKNAIGVSFVGNGEPFLNKDLFKMIDYTVNIRKMYAFVATNGTLLDKYIQEIVGSPIYSLSVSINSHNREDYNRITGMSLDVFDKIYQNVVALVKARNEANSKIRIILTLILDQKNYKYLQDKIDFVESLGVDEVFFYNYLPSPSEGFTASERSLFVDNADVLETFKNITLPKSKLLIGMCSLLERGKINNKLCSAYFYHLGVDGEGNIGGCQCKLMDLSLYGKYNEPDAWNNEHFRRMRRMFLDKSEPLLESCQFCPNNADAVPTSSINTGTSSKFLKRWIMRLHRRK